MKLHDTASTPIRLRAPDVPFSMAERYEASGNPILTYVLVPLGAGVVTFAGLGLICWGAGWQVRVALILAGIAICAVWGILTWMLARQRLVQTIERVYGLAGPQVEQRRPEIRIIAQTPNRNQLRYLDLPLKDADSAREFAMRLAAGYPFSESEWTGKGAMFSKREFRTVRDRMIAVGMAAWRNEDAPSQGVELTAYGRHVIREIAGQTEPAGLLEGE